MSVDLQMLVWYKRRASSNHNHTASTDGIRTCQLIPMWAGTSHWHGSSNESRVCLFIYFQVKTARPWPRRSAWTARRSSPSSSCSASSSCSCSWWWWPWWFRFTDPGWGLQARWASWKAPASTRSHDSPSPTTSRRKAISVRWFQGSAPLSDFFTCSSFALRCFLTA